MIHIGLQWWSQYSRTTRMFLALLDSHWVFVLCTSNTFTQYKFTVIFTTLAVQCHSLTWCNMCSVHWYDLKMFPLSQQWKYFKILSVIFHFFFTCSVMDALVDSTCKCVCVCVHAHTHISVPHCNYTSASDINWCKFEHFLGQKSVVHFSVKVL